MNKSQLRRRNDKVIRRLDRLGQRTKRQIAVLALVRLLSFLMSSLCGAASVLDNAWMPYGPISVVGALIFVVVVRMHRRPFYLLPRIEQARINTQRSTERMLHQWGTLDSGDVFLDSSRPELAELRIFGEGSVFQQLCRTGLSSSQRALAQRLSTGMDAIAIEQHQQAIASLMSKVVFRRRMEVESRCLSITPTALEQAINWAQDAGQTVARLALIRWLSIVLCLSTAVQIVMSIVWDLDTLWQLTFLGQVIVFVSTTGRLGASYSFLIGDEKNRPLSSLASLFRLCETQVFTADFLKERQSDLKVNEHGSTFKELDEFNRIIERLSVRHGPMLHTLLGICVGWEVHGVFALEAWRKRIGGRIRSAVEALTEIELVLCGCGVFEELDVSCFPKVFDSPEANVLLNFEKVGHPSIPADVRKYNDFSVERPGQVSLITGSNMSGKSTFLRTVGINVFLAQAGMPICAKSASVTRCNVISSIQVTDMPERGLSRFHAEVLRLKSILDDVNDKATLSFFLIDEMLSGTNSRERSIACKAVISQLHGAESGFGIVTTHDLELAQDPNGPPLSFYHFADRFDGTALHFDYQLRSGVATTTNAIRVLEIEGVSIAKGE